MIQLKRKPEKLLLLGDNDLNLIPFFPIIPLNRLFNPVTVFLFYPPIYMGIG